MQHNVNPCFRSIGQRHRHFLSLHVPLVRELAITPRRMKDLRDFVLKQVPLFIQRKCNRFLGSGLWNGILAHSPAIVSVDLWPNAILRHQLLRLREAGREAGGGDGFVALNAGGDGEVEGEELDSSTNRLALGRLILVKGLVIPVA